MWILVLGLTDWLCTSLLVIAPCSRGRKSAAEDASLLFFNACDACRLCCLTTLVRWWVWRCTPPTNTSSQPPLTGLGPSMTWTPCCVWLRCASAAVYLFVHAVPQADVNPMDFTKFTCHHLLDAPLPLSPPLPWPRMRCREWSSSCFDLCWQHGDSCCLPGTTDVMLFVHTLAPSV